MTEPPDERRSISWNADNAISCTVTGTNGNVWTDTSGSETSSPITEVTQYILTCDDADPDTTEDDLTDRVTVVRVPSWVEI